MYSDNSFAEGYAIGRDSNSNGNGGFGFGNGDGAWWIIILLIFGWGGGRGFGGGNCGCGSTCATQADLAAGFNNSAVLSNLNDLALGQAGIQQTLCQGFNGVNTTVLQGFNGVDNAICSLGYQGAQHASNLSAQLADCCCKTQGAIKDASTQSVFNTNAIQRQISDCCCDLEKTAMQSRYDAQAYNCNTLQAIDKLGDRIIDYMAAEKAQSLRDENFALKLQASQAAQNTFITANQQAQTAELIRRLGADCPTPAYVVQPPTPVNFPLNCCGQVQFSNSNNNSNGCGCGCY